MLLLTTFQHPTEVPAIKGTKMDNPDEELQVESTDDGEFASLAFKIMTDPFVGQLTFIRVYRGSLESGSYRSKLYQREERESW